MRVLVIDIDSLRPDHLGCYGYERNTSPTIDSVARDGVRFEECYASDTPCLPSRTALATCRFGVKSGVVTHFGSGQWYREPGSGHDQDPERPLSFRHLFEHGVRTATVTSFAQRHLAYHFTASFQEHVQPSAAGAIATEDGSDVTEAATGWLDRHGADNDWLLHVNYWDVHHPYIGISPFVDEVRDSGPAASWPDQSAIDRQQGTTGPRTANLWPTAENFGDEAIRELRSEWPFPDRIADRADVEHLLTGYDAAIRKVDLEVEELLTALDRLGIREETAVVITSDHGESFGEHGIYAEHAFPHEACQRVPLIVSWPGVDDDRTDHTSDGEDGDDDTTEDNGAAVEALVHQFDLVPTVCDLLGVPIPGGWDAEPFTAALRGDDFEGREHVVCGHGIYTFGRTVYTDEWTYTRLFHPGAFSHPRLYNDFDLPEGGLELLHDRTSDAPTAENLIAECPDVAAELRRVLADWTVRMVHSGKRDLAGRDPLWEMAATEGPFLYYDPDALAELYHELGRSEEQLAAVDRCRSFPRLD